jgi:hypothetical protein
MNQASATSTVDVIPPLKLYGFDASQPTRSVLMLCAEAQIPYEYVVIDILNGEHKVIKVHAKFSIIPFYSITEVIYYLL